MAFPQRPHFEEAKTWRVSFSRSTADSPVEQDVVDIAAAIMPAPINSNDVAGSVHADPLGQTRTQPPVHRRGREFDIVTLMERPPMRISIGSSAASSSSARTSDWPLSYRQIFAREAMLFRIDQSPGIIASGIKLPAALQLRGADEVVFT